jgi:hypothetical protein
MEKLALVSILLFFISCQQPTNTTGQEIGQEFTLRYGQSTQIQSHDIFSIKFLNVVEDSRCPKGAVCVWEGNAKIILQIAEQDSSVNTTLLPKEAIYKGREGIEYTIRLVSVSPYPNVGEQVKLEDYYITLIVFTNEIF